MQEVLDCVAQGHGRVTRVMLDNMVVPLGNGDVDVSMLQEAVDLIGGKIETEVTVLNPKPASKAVILIPFMQVHISFHH